MTNDTAVTVTYRTPWGTTSTGTIEDSHHQTGETLIRDHATQQTVWVTHDRITNTEK